MRNVLILTFILICSTSSFSQDSFEGSIHYSYSYESLYRFITTEYIQKTFPTQEIKTYKGAKFVVETINGNKPDTVKTIYDLAEQTCYVIYPASDTIKQFTYNSIPGQLLKSTKSSLTQTVLGKTCPAIELEYIADQYKGKKMTCVYYYDTDLSLDPANYQAFKQSYWNLYTSLAQALPVASSVSYEELYRVDAVATKISPAAVPDSFFELPEGKVIVKGE